MHILQGNSHAPDGAVAVVEATAAWTESPDIIFAFCSTTQNAETVAAALAQKYPGTPIAGCTTAGEHLSGAHHRGSLVVAGLVDSGVTWACEVVRGLADVDGADVEAVVGRLFGSVGFDPDASDPDDLFALLFIDGLSRQEERLTALLDSALQGVPMAGGSAGDDLAFKRTHVLNATGAHSDALVLVVGKPEHTRVKVLKHQHFTATDRYLVITKADPDRRRVLEIDGYPAVAAYAAALGLRSDEVTGDVTFLHPVTFRYQGELYVRSIQAVHEDGSLDFYCAIEEGMVLDVGGHEAMAPALSSDLSTLRDDLGRLDFVLGFNCILRALETEGAGESGTIGSAFSSACTAMIGFDTYGEQLHGLHINQTLVAVGFAGAA